MHTVELLFDAALEAGVRDAWARLQAAGLRSLAAHGHPTNRPHLTLVTTGRLDRLPTLSLPVPVSLGPAVMLGRTLARAVDDGPELRKLHDLVWQSVEPSNPLHSPGRWMPHVSLALRVPATQVSPALDLLRDLAPAHGQLVAARSYDTESRITVDL
ncbi:2'-5' RNA ligase family protein [Actinoplanes sp. NBC_00393]|uniref:2'-5' RNA ligase family protein n=1 Tax=Actinoplanes sp. NBC_00393 TaxID=2975953 RepID=UPI002E2312BC